MASYIFKVYFRSVSTTDGLTTLYCDLFSLISADSIDEAIDKANTSLGFQLKRRSLQFFLPLREITAELKGTTGEIMYYHDDSTYSAIVERRLAAGKVKDELLPLYNHYKINTPFVTKVRENYFE